MIISSQSDTKTWAGMNYIVTLPPSLLPQPPSSLSHGQTEAFRWQMIGIMHKYLHTYAQTFKNNNVAVIYHKICPYVSSTTTFSTYIVQWFCDRYGI